MSGYLAALAALAVGTAPRLRPRALGRFEPEEPEPAGFLTEQERWPAAPPPARPTGPPPAPESPSPLPPSPGAPAVVAAAPAGPGAT
ncbi:hypothetical protein B5D80_26320, partial [Micromonospora wenchangensis]